MREREKGAALVLGMRMLLMVMRGGGWAGESMRRYSERPYKQAASFELPLDVERKQCFGEAALRRAPVPTRRAPVPPTIVGKELRGLFSLYTMG